MQMIELIVRFFIPPMLIVSMLVLAILAGFQLGKPWANRKTWAIILAVSLVLLAVGTLQTRWIKNTFTAAGVIYNLADVGFLAGILMGVLELLAAVLCRKRAKERAEKEEE